MSRRLATIALWLGLGGALAVTGYLLLNTTYMPYDDEGFLLISLRNYLAGLRLYDDVFSQYGPWPYVYHQIVTTLGGGALMTHTLGRALTLFHWVAMALLCGFITGRLVRSQLAALVTSVFVFGLTWQMTSEPSHPGSLISLLLALAGVLLAGLPEAKRPGRHFAGLGVIIGLLLLTKINVGLLLAAGVGCWILRFTAWPGAGPKLAWLGPAGLLAVPWVLLGKQLHLDWVLTFAGIFTVAAASLLWVTPPRALSPRHAVRDWIGAVPAALATVAVLCVWVGLRGTSLASLVQAVLIGPLRMPAKFMVGVTWYAPVIPVAVISALIAAKAGWELRQQGRLASATVWLVVAGRLFALGAFLVQIRNWPTYHGIFHFTCYCLPLLPLFVIPLRNDGDERRRLAFWGLAAVALLQVLHAFPVAGSQLAWATFLCVPVLAVGLWEAGAVARQSPVIAGRRLTLAGAAVLGAAALFTLGQLGNAGWNRWRTSRPLDLPGGEHIRLDGTTRQALRLLNLNASIHADVLFSRQGMYSHNLWSGVPTPTTQNATHWFWLLNETQQREIAARLAAVPRTALITSQSIDRFMIDFKIPVTGPLQDFVQAHYEPLFRYGDFTFSVPRGSTAVPFGRYEVKEAATDDPTVLPLLFSTDVLLDGAPGRIGLEMINYPWSAGPELLTPAARGVAQPIDRQGRALGEPIDLATRPMLRGLYRLALFAPRLPDGLPWQNYALVVRASDGTVLSESVY
jgi:hypothetical protein